MIPQYASDFQTVLQTLLRFKQPKSNVIDSKEMISATVQAAFIYTQILSLTRGTEITFLSDDSLKYPKFSESSKLNI